ncbi:hypothetical protein HN51_067136 [Arachis hypogaea]
MGSTSSTFATDKYTTTASTCRLIIGICSRAKATDYCQSSMEITVMTFMRILIIISIPCYPIFYALNAVTRAITEDIKLMYDMTQHGQVMKRFLKRLDKGDS